MKNNRFEIKLNDGVIRNVIIDEYDPVQIAEDLNNPDKHMIAIGTGDGAVVVQRYSVVRIVPSDIEEESNENDSDDE